MVVDRPVRQNDVVELLVAAAMPSIAASWEQHLEFWTGEELRGASNDVGVVAHHLVELMNRGETTPVRSVLDVVECLLAGPLEIDVRNLVVGLLEDLQNITSHDYVPVGSSSFVPLLGSRTKAAWEALHVGWGSSDT